MYPTINARSCPTATSRCTHAEAATFCTSTVAETGRAQQISAGESTHLNLVQPATIGAARATAWIFGVSPMDRVAAGCDRESFLLPINFAGDIHLLNAIDIK